MKHPTPDPNAIANAIVAGVDAAPAALHGNYFVRLDGKLYDVAFTRGEVTSVSVTYTTRPSWGPSRRTGRNIWYGGYRPKEQPSPTSVAGKVTAMVRDPALAKAAGAKVESPEQRAAYWRGVEDRAEIQKRAAARRERLADAAPAVLAALKAALAPLHHAASQGVDGAEAAHDAAVAAILKAEGEG